MKLNLGCGNDVKEGYVNVDIKPLSTYKYDGVWYAANKVKLNEKTEYLVRDLREPLWLKNNTADYILAKDILEHFSWRDTERIFTDWVRVLKKKGKLKLIVPNVDVHIKYYQDKVGRKDFPNPFEYFRGLLFGHQDYSGNFHKTCFNPDAVKELFIRHKLYMLEFDLNARAIIAVGEKK